MANYTPAYEKILANEGGYSNDPRDRGGETYKGIARNMNPRWEGWEVCDAIKANTRPEQLAKALAADDELNEMVHDFYKLAFWDPLQLDSVNPQELANEVFDSAVNQGAVVAVKHLQEALNLLNNNQKHYSDINEDGHMGPATIQALNAYLLTSKFAGRSLDKNTRVLLKAYNGLQFARYVDICNANPLQEVYFYGWVERV